MNVLLITLQQLRRSANVLLLMYGLTLVLGLLVAIPFYKTLLAEDQNSLAFQNLLTGFDYTVFSDFMHRSSRSLSPLLSVGRWIGLLYVVLSLFFAGGILTRFQHFSSISEAYTFSIGLFLHACTHYVGRFLGLFGITLLFIITGGGVWLIAGTLAIFLLDNMFTEQGLFWIGFFFFTLFLLTITFLLCIGDYAKVIIVREDERNPFRAFGQAGKLVVRYVGKTYGYYCLFMLIGLVLFGIYFLVDLAITMSGWVTILLMFVIQQFLIFTRVGLKIWSLGLAYALYDTFPKPMQRTQIVTEQIPSSDEQNLSELAE